MRERKSRMSFISSRGKGTNALEAKVDSKGETTLYGDPPCGERTSLVSCSVSRWNNNVPKSCCSRRHEVSVASGQCPEDLQDYAKVGLASDSQSSSTREMYMQVSSCHCVSYEIDINKVLSMLSQRIILLCVTTSLARRGWTILSLYMIQVKNNFFYF